MILPVSDHDRTPRRPEFQPGQLVRHRRYGYRGVVVGLDPKCMADQQWYSTNQTQPARSQAWYHVLVHQAEHTTYAAESNLEADPGGEPVDHPLVPIFFSSFEGGRYTRNTKPWET